MKKIRFTQKQKDAFAKNFDNIGVAVIIAVLVGAFVESKVSLLNGFMLGIIAIVCFLYAAFLRKGE